MGSLFVCLAIAALLLAGLIVFGIAVMPKNLLDFAAFVSLAVTCVAAYVAIRIFWNQAAQARADSSAQAVLLERIGQSSLTAAQRAGSAEGNTTEILRLLNEVQESKTKHPLSEERSARALSAYAATTKGAGQVLWVDDNVGWIEQERKTVEAAGVATVWVPDTARALDLLEENSFNVVITDMRRPEGDREGLVLLDAMRARGDDTPVIVYSGTRRQDRVDEVLDHGGQGATNDPAELFELVMRELA
ncbi:response regulator [Agreia bicolorata]|uniref:response regulator n=1 Tax=Agreia bicolorata TaxID=110935 RepID=UPI00159050FE|nr:response regulator [Agreia bicolorata]